MNHHQQTAPAGCDAAAQERTRSIARIVARNIGSRSISIETKAELRAGNVRSGAARPELP